MHACMHAFAQLRAAMQFGKKIITPAQPPGGSGVCEGGFVYRMDVVTACGCIGSVLHDEWTQHRMSGVSGRDSEAPGSYLCLPETHQVAELPTHTGHQHRKGLGGRSQSINYPRLQQIRCPK